MFRINFKLKNVANVLFLYWFIIIIWQTIRIVGNHSALDIAFKAFMLLLLVFYAVMTTRARASQNFGIAFLFFVITQIITLIFDTGDLALTHIVTILFIFLQIILFFIMLNEAKISPLDLENFGKLLVIFVVAMCIYNMIDQWGNYVRIFTGNTSKYGFECKSFLYSNHEFGLYTATAIIMLTWLITRLEQNKKVLVAIILYPLFATNLLSTYSRTAILGCLIAILILLFFYKKKVFVGFVIFFIIAIIICLTNEKLYDIIFKKILKGSFVDGQVFDDGRSSQYSEEWENYIKSNDLLRLFFGFGYSGGKSLSGHNAYISILCTGGFFMMFNFIIVIGYGIYCSVYCLKYSASVGSCLLGFITMGLCYMISQTAIFFYSTMDSFFLTAIGIIIPMYCKNYFMYRDKKQL